MRTGDGRCKLGDLGFAISVAERPRSRLGTLIMMSPEILAAKPKRVNMDNLRDSLVGGAAGGGAYGTEVDVSHSPILSSLTCTYLRAAVAKLLL